MYGEVRPLHASERLAQAMLGAEKESVRSEGRRGGADGDKDR
jgi:hypothetical protein